MQRNFEGTQTDTDLCGFDWQFVARDPLEVFLQQSLGVVLSDLLASHLPSTTKLINFQTKLITNHPNQKTKLSETTKHTKNFRTQNTKTNTTHQTKTKKKAQKQRSECTKMATSEKETKKCGRLPLNREASRGGGGVRVAVYKKINGQVGEAQDQNAPQWSSIYIVGQIWNSFLILKYRILDP